MQIICPYCKCIAIESKLSKTVEITECTNPECNKAWETKYYQRLWEKQRKKEIDNNEHSNKKLCI